jgi:hypothetical protein
MTAGGDTTVEPTTTVGWVQPRAARRSDYAGVGEHVAACRHRGGREEGRQEARWRGRRAGRTMERGHGDA